MTETLWTLAFDHRNSLRRAFFGISGDATEADHARARDANALIFRRHREGDEAVVRIAQNYLRLIGVYLATRRGRNIDDRSATLT